MTVETADSTQYEPQRMLGDLIGSDAEVGDDRGHSLLDLCRAVVAEVAVAPVALGKRRRRR